MNGGVGWLVGRGVRGEVGGRVVLEDKWGPGRLLERLGFVDGLLRLSYF